jgi:hypothetical protein
MNTKEIKLVKSEYETKTTKDTLKREDIEDAARRWRGLHLI